MKEPHISSSTSRPQPSVTGRLLATLLSQNTLVQPEVALTRATQFLLSLPGGANALDDLVASSGLAPEPGGYWLTEVRGDEGGRTDLEYRWGNDSTVHVIVEAKVGHALSSDQLDDYRSRLGADGLLVVLVPITRRREGAQVVDELRSRYEVAGDSARVDLWTWDDVASKLEAALPGEPDVVQLRGLIDAAGALDILPFGEGELVTTDPTRFDDLWAVLDRASFKAGFPAQRGGYFQRHRFFEVGDFGAHFSVGIGRVGSTEPEPWIWVRIWDGSHLGRAQQEVVKLHRLDAERDRDCLVFPLELEPGLSGYEMAESLRSQLHEVAGQLREGLRRSLAVIARKDGPVEAKILAPLVGIPPFRAAELLDSDLSRRQDIETVVRQVCRHIFGGAASRWVKADAAFAMRNWIQVDPYRSHLSIGIARVDDSPTPRPWAWLSIHEVTPHSDVAFLALDEAFPGSVVEIPRGRGLPLSIPEGATGVEAFASVVAQIERAKAALRTALQGASEGD